MKNRVDGEGRAEQNYGTAEDGAGVKIQGSWVR